MLFFALQKNFLVPFKQHKLDTQLFDDTMALFQCERVHVYNKVHNIVLIIIMIIVPGYIKRITIPSGAVSVNVTNCLPLYLNLFYFEVHTHTHILYTCFTISLTVSFACCVRFPRAIVVRLLSV